MSENDTTSDIEPLDEHSKWFGEQSQFCDGAMEDIIEFVRNSDVLELRRHGTTINSDGDHETHIRFGVDGEPFEGEE